MRTLALLVATGCAIGAPPGFSSGTQWTFPLVDPLAGGRLVVPVMVHGKGPFLFAIDRDAASTIVDPEIAAAAEARATGELRVDDYDDHTHPAFYAEITDVEIGNLTISLLPVQVLPRPGHFDEDGRHISGVIGRKLVADSLVFGFDRDRGIAWLETQQAFVPPPAATVLALDGISSSGVKVAWRPVVKDAKIGAAAVDLHPDFSRVASELALDKWHAAGLAPTDAALKIIDSSGIVRDVTQLGVAPAVTVATASRDHVGFVPYDDRRLWQYKLDGVLGLDFFRPFKVAADWHHEKIYLTPREDLAATRATRLARWGELFAPCPDPGCATFELVTVAEGEGPGMRVHRDRGFLGPLEVILRATAKSGEPLPNLELNFPADASAFDTQLPQRYLGATFEIVDASPFPRACPYVGGCAMTQPVLPP
ncbi:MAG TPA: hypothetical protein VGF94_22475 [Kofleriaceae bacterium]|jgi:hypothetical protein